MDPPLYSWQRGERPNGGSRGLWAALTAAPEDLIVPAGAVKASDRMYVVRNPAGDVGKFICNEGTAKFPINGSERTLDDFQFLVLASGAEAVWLLGAPDTSDCVYASDRMVVIRATDHPDRDPGKFITDENSAKIPRNGKEVTLQQEDYEYLVVRRQSRLYPVLAAPAYSWQNPLYPPSSGLYSWQCGEPCSRPPSPGGSTSEGLLVPVGAVKASDRTYVVRNAAGDVGKFVADEGGFTATFGLNGGERALNDFEFLVLPEGVAPFWAHGTTEPPPPREEWAWASERMAVMCAPPASNSRTLAPSSPHPFGFSTGRRASGLLLTRLDPPPWRSRATDHPDREPGKFIADENAAKVPRGGREVTLRPEDFEFLTLRRAGALRGSTPPPDYSASPPTRGPFGSLFGGNSQGGGAAAGSDTAAGGGAAAASAEAFGAMGTAGAAAHALAERGEKLSGLEGATQRMALEAESFASMATQLKEQQKGRSLFPW